MATVEFMDGAELGHSYLWDGVGGAPSTGAEAAGFTGSYYWADARHNWKNITARTSYYFGFRGKHSNWSGAQVLAVHGVNNSALLGYLQMDDYSGRYKWICHGVSSTLTSMIIPINTVVRVEVYVLKNTYAGTTPNNDGIVTVKVNGVIVLNQTGFRSLGSDYNIDTFHMNLSNYNEFGYDDVICVRDAWPGNVRIQKGIPDGSGDDTTWDPSAGSNFDCINEIPYSDTDFVSTNVNDEVDTYTMSDLVEGTNPIDSILAVQVSARSKLEGAPTPQDLQVAVKSGSTYGYSASHQVQSDTYDWFSNVWNVNPATSAAFTPAEINSLKIGIKAKARP